jgi:transposase
MEACASAHYWARALMSHGFTVKLIAPQFVKPYVKSNKNDAVAIAEAMSCPHMRFVAVKSIDQQDIQALHRVRDFAASLGLNPRQHSMDGKDRLLGISKRGDSDLRKLLDHGA